MIDCAKRTGSVFTVHQNRRHDPDYLHVREAIETGLLGDVFQIESRVTGARGIPEGWRLYAVAGGGMMLDWGVHLIDQMTNMFPGHKVTSIYCNMYHVVYKECDDGFKLTMKFDNGAVCQPLHRRAPLVRVRQPRHPVHPHLGLQRAYRAGQGI